MTYEPEIGEPQYEPDPLSITEEQRLSMQNDEVQPRELLEDHVTKILTKVAEDVNWIVVQLDKLVKRWGDK